jgi:hypothetical protein
LARVERHGAATAARRSRLAVTIRHVRPERSNHRRGRCRLRTALLRDGLLWRIDDAALLEELSTVRLRETAPGQYRVDHDPGRHDDRVIALGLAVASLLAAPSSHKAYVFKPTMPTPIGPVGARYAQRRGAGADGVTSPRASERTGLRTSHHALHPARVPVAIVWERREMEASRARAHHPRRTEACAAGAGSSQACLPPRRRSSCRTTTAWPTRASSPRW